MNILLVDDERHIVNYLTELLYAQIDEDLDIRRAYSASQALGIMYAQKIDLMLLDIQMPGMSGLELAEKVASMWPRCHIIFLTAFDHFDYVYQASRVAHTSYLLKTESDKTILTEVRRHLQDLTSEVETRLLLDDVQNKDRCLSHLLQQNILKELLHGHTSGNLEAELQLAGANFCLDLSRPVYLGYMVFHLRSIDEYQTNMSMLAMKYLAPAEEFLDGRFTCAMLHLNHGAMLWFFQPPDTFQEPAPTGLTFLKGFAEDLINYSMTCLHRNLNFILYPEAVMHSMIHSVYYQLLEQLDVSQPQTDYPPSSVSVFEKKQKIPLPDTLSVGQGFTDQKLQLLSFALYQNSPEEYFHTLQELKEQCCTLRSMHSLDAIQIYMGISVMLLSYVNLYHLQEKMASQIALYPLYHLGDFRTWVHAFDYLRKLSRLLFDLLTINTINKNEAVIQKIKAYINAHLSDSISLSDLSSVVNYNDTYISRLFHQHTGIKLSEYIYQERITRARYLLSTTGDSIHMIAAKAGFDSSQYFSSMFKKAVGISPSEYQRIHYYKITPEL